jgi:ABC-2 type transport system permease protein
MTGILAALLRILAIVGKELLETIRRPWSVLSIVLGPFVILIVFGLGYVGQGTIRVAIVIPVESGLPSDLATYQQAAGSAIQIVGVDPDAAVARARLARREVDLVVIAPTDWQADARAGRQAVLSIEYDSIDPYSGLITTTAASRIEAAVNREIIRMAAQRTVDAAASAGASIPPEARPELIAAPTRVEVRDLAPTAPSITWFYGIAVLVLIVQHLAVTLGALSLYRDRQRGLVELFRLSPIRSGELLLGKYIAIGLIGGIVAAGMVTLLIGAFGLPVIGDPRNAVSAIALLIVAGTGIGLIIALASDSERQVVQLTLLVLLASVFFGGLAVDLAQFSWPVQRAAEALPITQASRIIQDVFLRGAQGEPVAYLVLALLGVVTFLGAAGLLHRALAPKE